MTEQEARNLAIASINSLPIDDLSRLKSVHVAPKLHQGMLVVRMFFVNKTAEDPEPFIFLPEELLTKENV